MKTYRQFLPLLLIATPPLLAQNGVERTVCPHENTNCSTCCCSPCCCKPESAPQPDACCSYADDCCTSDCSCVATESYAPAFYNLRRDCGYFFNIEFLYWYAQETNLSYATVVNRQPRVSSNADFLFGVSDYEYVDAAWDPGFRIGIGWNAPCDGWDSSLTWTWMQNCKTDTTSVPLFTSDLLQNTNNPILLNPWINQSYHQDGIALYDTIKAKWSLLYNQIDLEIGRKYWNSCTFTLRPYLALRGAWWKTRFNTTSIRTNPTDAGIVQNTDFFTNRTWGVGFLAGLEPTFYICSNFALYGNLDAALLWGRFESKKRETIFVENPLTEVFRVDYQNRSRAEFYQMTPMLDLAIGIRWEETWCRSRYRTSLDLGWEHHTLFDQNHRMLTHDNFVDDTTVFGFRSNSEATGNLSMGGFVLRLHADF